VCHSVSLVYPVSTLRLATSHFARSRCRISLSLTQTSVEYVLQTFLAKCISESSEVGVGRGLAVPVPVQCAVCLVRFAASSCLPRPASCTVYILTSLACLSRHICLAQAFCACAVGWRPGRPAGWLARGAQLRAVARPAARRRKAARGRLRARKNESESWLPSAGIRCVRFDLVAKRWIDHHC
jgi:hypothetical protein